MLLLRCCGRDCYAYMGQFLYLNSTSSNDLNDTTLVACAPSSAVSLTYGSGCHFAGSYSCFLTRSNFTFCYCLFYGSALIL
jgi:hypothetical protein